MSDRVQSNQISGRAAFVELLQAEGVAQIFGNPGTTELPIMHALADHPEMGYVLGLQEAIVVAMADGYARVSGRLGVASVHQGPGLTNAITGLTGAAKSRTPLILLAADTPAAQLRSNFKIDQDALVEAVGAVAATVAALVALVASCALVVQAQDLTEVTINDTDTQAENVTSSADGSVYFGSTAKGTVYRAAPGAHDAAAARPSTVTLAPRFSPRPAACSPSVA